MRLYIYVCTFYISSGIVVTKHDNFVGCMYLYIYKHIITLFTNSYSVSPIGDVPTTPPASPLYKYETAKEGEMFHFAVSR